MANPITVKVTRVREETADAKSFVLEADEPLSYLPGQFITVSIPTKDGRKIARCFSLSSAPFESDKHIVITVKRTPGGAGTPWICDVLTEGDRIDILPPGGRFTPDSTHRDFLLFGAGSGITPLMSIIKTALHKLDNKLTLVYVNRSEKSTIFLTELMELCEKYPARLRVQLWFTSQDARPSPKDLRTIASSSVEAEAFVCGPTHFMDMCVEVLRDIGIPSGLIHQERYISLTGDPFAPVTTEETQAEGSSDPAASASFSVVSGELNGSSFAFTDWPSNKKLLDFLLEKGLDAPHSCRMGQCSSCAFQLLDGEVQLLHNEVLDDEDLKDGIRLACQALPETDEIKMSYDF